MAKAYSSRPSDLLAVEDPYEAFRIDRAVWVFGSQLSAELKRVKGKTDQELEGKSKMVMARWIPETSTPTAKQFRDPARRGQTL